MSTLPAFDGELLKRYDRPGPRYTSYPTAPHFTGAVGESQLRDHARRGNQAADLFDRSRTVVQLHLGGGTPNFLRPAQLEELVGTVKSLLRVIAMCFDRYLQSPDAAIGQPRFSQVV